MAKACIFSLLVAGIEDPFGEDRATPYIVLLRRLSRAKCGIDLLIECSRQTSNRLKGLDVGCLMSMSNGNRVHAAYNRDIYTMSCSREPPEQNGVQIHMLPPSEPAIPT